MSESKNTEILLQRPSTPFNAVPFDKIKNEHFIPALETAIAEAKKRIEKIKQQTVSPNFDNTLLALETAPEHVNYIAGVFFNLLSSESSDELQALAKEISPKLADFSSDILLDEELFARMKSLYDNKDQLNLNHEQHQLLEKTYKDFTRNGALLSADKKAQLRSLDQELSRLGPEFSDNVLKATNSYELVITDPQHLSGLPDAAVEAAAQTAHEAGKEGSWRFTLHAPSFIPFVTYADNRELREKMWRAYNSRSFGGTFDNQAICRKIVQLRHDRARLLGYETHADFVLEERMAESPGKVLEFMDRLLSASRKAAERDVEAVRQLKKDLTGDADLAPWDFAYYSEKLKKRDFDLDEEQLRPYFKLENVIAGVFEHARRLYGLVFKPLSGIPVYHPDVRVYEVTQEEDGRHLGLFYADFFPRSSKRGGAWMTSFRDQGLFEGEVQRPHVSIVCNFTKPTPSKPSLLTLDEVHTLFHEFGHSLHALLSECTYPSLSGTSVYWDFVELPSQIMENWVLEKEALDLFATHYQTGEKIPHELAEKIKKSATFQAGYRSLRQLNFGLLDMAWHSQDPANVVDISEFERAVTQKTSVLPIIPGTNISTSFSHIFAGGYSAGYYSYKWAEVLDADAFELFKEQGLFNKDVAQRFRKAVLSRGGTRHPMDLYKEFRGREPDPDALLRREGLIP